jgi:hypothetical protein
MAISAYLDIDQGSDFTTDIELENDNSTPMNLTGFIVYSQFRKSYGSTIAYSFEASIPTPGSQGKIRLKLSGVNSSLIKPGRYLYDVEIVSNTGSKTRVVEGILTINPEITKIP